MPILFDFYHSPSTEISGEEKKEKYHARVVTNSAVDLDNIVDNISQRCTLSKGDILAVINELSFEIANGLLNGKNVNIPELGLFSLSLKAPKDANPKTTHAQHIKVKRIEFRAGHELKQKVLPNARFERTPDKVHSAHINIYEVDALLVDYFEEHAYITRKEFEDLCHFTRSTATRHLKRLLSEGRLVNSNTTTSPIYVPAKGCYNR